MIRADAIGQGAGTQAVLFISWAVTLGEPEERHVVLHKVLIHAAAWVLNLAIAEWVIRRRPSRRTRSAAPAPAGA